MYNKFLHRCKWHSSYLLQFRNVIECSEESPRWTDAHIASFADDALELSLQSAENFRLYEKCKVSIGKGKEKRAKNKQQDAVGRQILQRLNKKVSVKEENEIGCSIRVERRSVVPYMERFFTHAAKKNTKFLYIYNCEHPPQGVESCLNGMSGHLDPTNNSRIIKMPGINTSMFYVGSAGSFTEMHVEDSLADSVNVVHAGKGKIWMIIDRRDYARTNQIVSQKLQDLSRTKDDDEGDKELKMCMLPLQHENLVLTPRLLDEHQIRHKFVVQKAGDLLYIRYGILHQVVNLGLNVTEAINIGSDRWNFNN